MKSFDKISSDFFGGDGRVFGVYVAIFFIFWAMSGQIDKFVRNGPNFETGAKIEEPILSKTIFQIIFNPK